MWKYLSVSVMMGSIAFLAYQAPVPGALANSAKSLQEAGAFTAAFTVSPAGGANQAYTLSYSKPNLFKIESPDGFVLSDGQSLYSYKKSANEYSSVPLTEALLSQSTGTEEVWGWMAFFAKDPYKSFKTAQVGAQRTIKGNQVTEVNATFGAEGKNSVTFFVDTKLGVVRGFALKANDKDLLAMASSLELKKEPSTASAFAFAAPDGSKKVEPAKAVDVPFAKVQDIFSNNCMPCHSADSRSGGMDFSSYDGILRGVRPGSADTSRIVRAIVSGRMPQGRARLSDADINTIKNWINAGAKNQ